MARRNVLVRHLPAVETLGSATVICTDKTGTLTENRMTVERLFLAGKSYETSDAESLNHLAKRHRPFFESVLCCENIKAANYTGQAEFLGDPTEVALVEMASRAIRDRPDYARIDEVPFDSDRKRLSTLHETPDGPVLFSKGALESLLPLATRVRTANGVEPLDTDWRQRLVSAQEKMADEGLRVMAIAQRPVPGDWDHETLERDLILEGLAGLEDPPRPNVPAAIQTCRDAGIRVVMLTGDHPQTAVAIARQIGLVQSNEPVVITGDRLQRMSNSELQLILDHSEVIFARMAPDQKLRIVKTLQRKGEIVAVTGDGVNDAPALKQADIGIAMGVTGTDAARETADLVLADDNFASIVAAVEEGRAVFDNVRKFLTYILTSNIPEIVPYLAFVLLRIPLPLTIIQILAVDLGTDMVPALGLGAEPPDPEVMHRPPRPRTERLLTWPLLSRAYLFLGLMEAAAAMAAYFFVLCWAGWTFGEEISAGHPLHAAYLQATTACLAAIVAMQIANVFLCRSDRRTFTAFPMFGNRLIVLGIATELLLLAAIVYTQFGNDVFGTAPLPWRVWLFIAPFPILMAALEGFRKRLVSKKMQPR
jgi:calcium-translocating P-type ATPase